MEVNVIVAVLLIFAGAVFLAASIVVTNKIKENVPDEVKQKWMISFGLMIFFLAGYIFAMLIMFFKVSVPLEIITGIIFMGGGVFVYIIISLARTTIQTIEVVKRGRVRRAKLYYLRERKGKAARIKERRR